VLVLAVALATGAASANPPPRVVVGSKAFTESVVLGEVAAALAREGGAEVVHRRQLGGTRVLWSALLAGEIDLYPEYTGTLEREILADEDVRGRAALEEALARRGVRLGAPLGFDNTYALGMKENRAERLGIRRISDLRAHPGLRFGFTNEFLDRGDGWPALRARYALPQTDVRGLEHDLAYRGLASGTLDVVDLYSTDADIRYYRLRVLEDDLAGFPEYEALFLWRSDLGERAPEVVRRFGRVAGRIDADAMIEANAQVKLEGVSERKAAGVLLARALGAIPPEPPDEDGLAARLARNTRDHLELVAVSLSAAIALALPLGVLAAKRPAAGAVILGAVGVLQTVPSLALLVLMIPLLGIGAPPAIAALLLYSLLPIVRNVHAGLRAIPEPLRESAEALGLPPAARLMRVELPLASPAILAGIKTSAVINVGTATLGALIGAGGYGQPILTGIRLDDVGLLLEGAVPAALLALAVQGLFDGLEKLVVPRGLRLGREG
jgi:osmoprotectant transport system permease protein